MEPERIIDKLLRSYAEKRRSRAGEPLRMHPATRRLLQGEVSRLAPKGKPLGSVWCLLGQLLRQRWAFLGILVAVAVILGAISLPVLSRRTAPIASLTPASLGMAERQVPAIARQNAVRPPPASNASIPPPETAAVGGIGGGGREVGVVYGTTTAGTASNNAATGEFALAANAQNSASFDLVKSQRGELPLLEKGSQNGKLGLENGPVQAAPAPPVATAAPAAVPETALMNSALITRNKDEGVALQERGIAMAPAPGSATSNALRDEFAVALKLSIADSSQMSPQASSQPPMAMQAWSYRNTAAQMISAEAPPALPSRLEQSRGNGLQSDFQNTFAPDAAANILARFDVQQMGNFIRIVDADSSVYTGPITAVAVTQRAGEVENAGQLKGIQSQPAQSYSFRVEGMNRTLRQNVVFSGNLIAIVNTPANAQRNFAGNIGAETLQEKAGRQQQLLLWNSRISGTAVVGSTNRINVSAVPVAP